MRFYRIKPNDGNFDAYWLCEDCSSSHDIDGFVIDSSGDPLGDLECEFCGMYFDHESMSYDTPE